jgi:hypothetical protein
LDAEVAVIEGIFPFVFVEEEGIGATEIFSILSFLSFFLFPLASPDSAVTAVSDCRWEG